jgi:oxygen-independent coproporphyrinogen III oxidase
MSLLTAVNKRLEPERSSPSIAVYVHIPFCQSRCLYCDFYLELAKYGGIEAFEQALLKEVQLRWEPLQGLLPPIHSIYVGGGTPSLLNAGFYKRLLQAFQRYTTLLPTAEITLEANPEDWASPAKAYREVGFNRLSLGVQSLDAAVLKKVGRRHTPAQALQAIEGAHHAGFTSLSVDLMMGLPGQSLSSWQATLESLNALPVHHVSAYGLQLEAGTPLETLVKKGLPAYALPQEEAAAEAYQMAQALLQHQGFEQYEISNWGKPGFASLHNLTYWQQGSYWAFGPSAHGAVYSQPYEAVRESTSLPHKAMAGLRYANVSSLSGYLTNPLKAKLESVSRNELMENTLIFGLRTQQGVCYSGFKQRFGETLTQVFAAPVNTLLQQGYLECSAKEQVLRIPKRWWGVSNSIVQHFVNVL